ncbi:hypothetical protein [Flagellimonas nanhaiensis]|uniref:Uncharacterized protein n=1 Tax=Flagellimonas nanhaiensis TaxID=2292706 RepID=A0A371JS36_9FLAO|nr:hypothetical protein [Allomuricauda nanhaiensis]RDY60615.1 hypothetical protein DX873_00065 [Allomuricauda nanhaiensis]
MSKEYQITKAFLLSVMFFTIAIGFSQEEKKTVEVLKVMKLSEDKLDDYIGEYSINDSNNLRIEVNAQNGRLAIILPKEDVEENGERYTVLEKLTLVAQYPDKFFVENNPFLKVHFTRSRKTNRIISLLFNANKVEERDVLRAKKVYHE